MRISYFYLLLVTFCFAQQSTAETFIYEESDGTRWITNLKMQGEGWKMIDKYGRATATKSCKGMTYNKLEARARNYMSLIEKYSAQHHMDPLFIKAVMRAESCFDRRAVSRAGAEGLMQLMPRTAESLGVLDSFNAKLNIEAGIRYLSRMKKQFKTSDLALAAYNAGPHNVKKYGGIPPFKETQNYVKKINKFYKQYLRKNIGLSAKN